MSGAAVVPHDPRLAAMVREGLARRRMSRAQLADAALISLSTLDKGLSGQRPFTLATIIRVEEVLGMRLRKMEVDATVTQAAADLGSYRKEGVDWLIGTYLTLRPSFERPDTVCAYLTRIGWDDGQGCLVFSEGERIDARFAQKGTISMPYQSGHIYCVTNEHGQFRTMTLSRPSISGDMHGLLMTLRASRGGRLTPAAAPIALLRQDTPIDVSALGQIDKGKPNFQPYRREIDRVIDEEFGLLIT